MKRLTLLASLLLLASLSMGAQEKQSSWFERISTKVLDSFTARKKGLDSMYVFQTPLKWTVSVESERLSPRASLLCDFSAKVSSGEGTTTRNGSLELGLEDRACQKIGLAAGYGSLRLGYGIQLGKKGGERNKYFGFGINSASYGGQIRYYKVHPCPSGSIAYAGGAPIPLTSTLPGELRSFAIDAFYAFNRNRFLFNATYTGRHLQRRSVGSWLVTAKYLQGDFSLDPDDPIGTRLGGAHRFATRQLSAGGGYSFNWVPIHRDPVDHTHGGLRNLTVNATVLPMASFLNILRTGERKNKESVQSENVPTFTPALRGAVCYTRDRWSFCAEAAYSNYSFRGAERDVAYPADLEPAHVKTSGTFHDFTVKGKINLHF